MAFGSRLSNNSLLFCVITALCFGMGFSSRVAAQPLILDKDIRQLNLAPAVEIFKDKTGQLTLQDIRNPSIQAQFQPSNTAAHQEINFGFTTDTYWLKVTLVRTAEAEADWILEIPYLNLNSVTFFAPNQKAIQVGTDYSADNKPIFYPLYALPLKLEKFPQSFYLRVQSDYALSIPLMLWSRPAFSHEFSDNLLGQALYFGGLLSLALYNLLLFISLRERSYLVYTCFALTMGLGMFAGNGYGRLYLWPEAQYWDNIAQTFFFGFAGALSLLFATSFLKTKTTAPRIHQMLRWLIGAYLISVSILWSSLWFNIPPALGFQLVLVSTIPATLGTLAAGVYAFRSGNRSALYFLIACSSVWTGATVAALRAFDLISTNGLTLYALQIGSCLEMLLLSFALAHRIHSERDQRLAAQEAELQTRNQLLTLTRENEALLERKVRDRTKILQKLALNEQEIRKQYVHFGAMISHEFRNPLGIIETQATLVQRETPLGINRVEERTETILSATHRLARLFDQWLNEFLTNALVQVCRHRQL